MTPGLTMAIDIWREPQSNGTDHWVVRWLSGEEIPPTTASNRANLFRATELAIASLPDTRTSKYTIKVYTNSTSPVTLAHKGSAYPQLENNFILDFQGATLSLPLGGGILNAYKCHNAEIRNVNVIGGENMYGFAFYPRQSNNFVVENVTVNGGDIGIRPEGLSALEGQALDSRYSQNIDIRGTCRFTNMKQHGIESFYVKDLDITANVTTNTTGGCGILLNATDDAYIQSLDASYASYSTGTHNYSGLRFANGSARATPNYVNYLRTYRCGRGFVAVTNPADMAGATFRSVNITDCTNWGFNLYYAARNIDVQGGYIEQCAWSALNIAGDTRDSSFQHLNLRNNYSYGLYVDDGAMGLDFYRVFCFGNNGAGSGIQSRLPAGALEDPSIINAVDCDFY
jgi:hypothetical protein